MQLPQGIIGWGVFAVGLLIVTYRVRGIDNPRGWIEWIERQFTYAVNLRFLGGIMLAFALALGYFGGFPQDALGWIFAVSMLIIAVVATGLLLMQNHLRHIVFATAESSDAMIRSMSVIIVLIGLGLMAAPFLL